MEKNNVLLQAFYADQVHFYHGDYVGFYCKQNHFGAESGTTLFQVQCKRGELAYPRCVERGKQAWTWGKAVGKVWGCSFSLVNRWMRVASCSPGDCSQLWAMRAECELEGMEGKGLGGLRMSRAAQGGNVGTHRAKLEEGAVNISTALMSPFTGEEPLKGWAGGTIANSK